MIEPRTYYESEKIKIVYSPSMSGYWLNIGENNHFFDERAYQDISKSTGLNLLDKLGAFDPTIPMNLRINNLLPSKLVEAFQTVKEIKQKEFEEFKKTQ